MPRTGFTPGDPRAVTSGRLGGIESRKIAKARAIAEVRAVWPGMPPAAELAILAYGDRRAHSVVSRNSRAKTREARARGAA